MGCGPSAPPSPHVWAVGARALWRSYADGADRWTGDAVRVTLGPGDYAVGPTSVRWYSRRPEEPADIVFVTPAPPPDNKAVVVTGTVYGRVRDGVRRPSGADWYLRVDGCSVAVR